MTPKRQLMSSRTTAQRLKLASPRLHDRVDDIESAAAVTVGLSDLSTYDTDGVVEDGRVAIDDGARVTLASNITSSASHGSSRRLPLFTPTSPPPAGSARQPRAPLGSIPRKTTHSFISDDWRRGQSAFSSVAPFSSRFRPESPRVDRGSSVEGTDVGATGEVGDGTDDDPFDEGASESEPWFAAQPHAADAQSRPLGIAPPLPSGSSPWAVYQHELGELMASALPVVTSSSLSSLLTLVDLMFIGQWLGPHYFAAGSLGNCWSNILYVCLSGAADALDRACGSALDRNDLPRLGLLAQRGVALLLLASLPVMGALGLTGHVLRGVFRQGEAVSTTAGSFCVSLIIGMVPLAAFLALTVVLRCQAGAGMSSGATWHIILIDAIANLVNVGANGLLIEVDGFMGAPLATSVSRTLQLAMLVGYLYVYRPFAAHGSWSGWRLREAVFGEGVDAGQTSPTASVPSGASSIVANGPDSSSEGGALGDSALGNRTPPRPITKASVYRLTPGGRRGGGGQAFTQVPPNAPPTPPSQLGPLAPMLWTAACSAAQFASESWCFELTYIIVGLLPHPRPHSHVPLVALSDSAPAPTPGANAAHGAAMRMLSVVVSNATQAHNASHGLPSSLASDNAHASFQPDIAAINAHSVLFSISQFLFVGVPLGLGMAGSARVSALLSAGYGKAAQATALSTVATGVLYMTAAAFVTLLCRTSVGRIFSQAVATNTHIASVAGYAAVFQLIDGYQGTLAGVLRGAGWSREVSILNGIGWWCIGLPAAAVLAHAYGHGLKGVWQGMCAANACLAIAYTLLYWRTDWEAAARRACASTPGQEAQQGAVNATTLPAAAYNGTLSRNGPTSTTSAGAMRSLFGATTSAGSLQLLGLASDAGAGISSLVADDDDDDRNSGPSFSPRKPEYGIARKIAGRPWRVGGGLAAADDGDAAPLIATSPRRWSVSSDDDDEGVQSPHPTVAAPGVAGGSRRRGDVVNATTPGLMAAVRAPAGTLLPPRVFASPSAASDHSRGTIVRGKAPATPRPAV